MTVRIGLPTILVIFFFGILSNVIACSCQSEPNPPCRAYSTTPTIFVGTVLESDPFDQKFEGKSRKALLSIDRKIKGQLTADQTLVFSDTRCGPFFEKGSTYLVYAWGTEQHLETGMCSRTSLIKEAGDDLQYFDTLSTIGEGALIFGHVKKFALHYGRNEVNGLSTPLSNVVVRLRGPKSKTFLTDKTGGFQAKGFPAGQYLLELKLPKGMRMSPNTKTREFDFFEVENKGCREATFYIKYQGEISGKVVDENGKGVAGLDVQLVSADYEYEGLNDTGPMLEWTVSREDGSYVFDGIPPGRYRLGIGIAGAFDVFGKKGQIFYPNTKDPFKAGIITLTETKKLRNINLRPPKIQ